MSLQFNVRRVSMWRSMYEICSCGDEKERSEAYFLMEEMKAHRSKFRLGNQIMCSG